MTRARRGAYGIARAREAWGIWQRLQRVFARSAGAHSCTYRCAATRYGRACLGTRSAVVSDCRGNDAAQVSRGRVPQSADGLKRDGRERDGQTAEEGTGSHATRRAQDSVRPSRRNATGPKCGRDAEPRCPRHRLTRSASNAERRPPASATVRRAIRDNARGYKPREAIPSYLADCPIMSGRWSDASDASAQ